MKREPRYSKGQRIANRFRVHQALMGGMGEVYLCLDEQNFVPLALKTFQGGSPDLANIFKQEVSNWIALEKHPNIVRCFWMEKLDSIPFMALEWVAGAEGKGADLRSWLRHGPLDLTLALKLTIDIVRGLQHANQKVPSIVHRDLKPDNVLVNQSQQAMISDFGLATVVQLAKLQAEGTGDEADMGKSRYVGNIVGTPAYMPPEQWHGETKIDFRADIYAIGCILYEMLTGKWPYNARTVSELRVQHLEAPLPVLNGDFPSELTRILEGCLAKQREDRYERLNMLFDALKTLYESHSDVNLPEVSAEVFTATNYHNRGITFGNLGQPERAIADFDEAIRLNPTSSHAYSSRSISYAKLGQLERAMDDINEAIRLDPANAIAYSNRGNRYDDLEEHERALVDHDEAIGLDPTFSVAYANRGNSYAALGQHQQAIADFDEAIRLDPTLADPYFNRANSYTALGQMERAITDYNEAIRLDPTLAVAYFNRGARNDDLGHYERAVADYDEAIRLDPIDVESYANRGNSYAHLRQQERAIADYDEAIRLDPTFAEAYSSRGTCYYDLGQAERAMADFDEALHLDATFALAYLNKAVLLASTGRLDEGIEWGQKAFRLGAPRAGEFVNELQQMMRQTSHQPEEREAEHAFRLLVSLYQEHGETGVRQFLQQKGVPTAQIDKLIIVVKQALGD